MLGLSGLDLEGHLSGKAVELTEGCLKFSAGKQIIHLAASCGNQKERAPQNQPKILQQVGHVFQVMKIAFGNCGVDLDRQVRLIGP